MRWSMSSATAATWSWWPSRSAGFLQPAHRTDCDREERRHDEGVQRAGGLGRWLHHGAASRPEQPLGVGGARLFDWYTNGDTPSRIFEGFRLCPASAAVFDAAAERVGAVISGRKTYDDSRGWDGGGPHPTAPLFVLSHRPPPGPPVSSDGQVFITTGIADAVSVARQAAAAAGKDVCLMGSGVVAAALQAGLLDEVILHQVPVLLSGGTPYFHGLASSVPLTLLEVVDAPGVTHLRFTVARVTGNGRT
jgi:dihydrofolate reductase